MHLLIKNGLAVLPSGTQRCDIAIDDGKIAAIAPELEARAGRVIDATGKLVFPGSIDAHTHMGIPIKDTTSADDFASGSKAAALGGVTTILDFTVQEKGQSLRQALDERIDGARGKSHVDFGIHVNVTDQPEKWLGQIPELIAEGFTSFKVFSTYREAGMMVTWEQFRKILAQVHRHGGLLMLHAEDNDLVTALTTKHRSAGYTVAIYHARSRTAEAEARAITEAARIAGELGAALYIVHLSSRAGLEAGLWAREQGVKIYLETCPQYLLLSEEKYLQENGHLYITTPPLRTRDDNEALWQALRDGHIDTVGTDHCPFTRAQKDAANGNFAETPNGLPGVETLFPLLYTYGVREGRISIERLVRVIAETPARLFGLWPRKGALQPGGDADLVIWDPAAESVVSDDTVACRADWSPYTGMRIAGRLEATLLRGKFLVENAKWLGHTPGGELLIAPKEN